MEQSWYSFWKAGAEEWTAVERVRKQKKKSKIIIFFNLKSWEQIKWCLHIIFIRLSLMKAMDLLLMHCIFLGKSWN